MKLTLTQRLAIQAIHIGTPIAEALGTFSGMVESMNLTRRFKKKTAPLEPVVVQDGVIEPFEAPEHIRRHLTNIGSGDPYMRDLYPDQTR
jgi:hypothetical protein